jgi:secreted trypsin-like serine protease
MRNHFRTYIRYFILITLIISGCADPNFTDKTKIDNSILMGEFVESADPIAERTVLIAQNFEPADSELKTKAQYFGLCTGIVLNSTTVLTAAHCLKNIKTTKIIQTNNFFDQDITNKQTYDIKKVILHESYLIAKKKDPNDFAHDIAIIQLNHSLTHTNFDTNENLKKQTEPQLFDAFIVGYGKNRRKSDKNEEIPLNGILEKAQVIITNDQLNEQFILINQNEKSGVCSGDSGGPLFISHERRYYLQGLAVAVTGADSDKNQIENSECNGTGLYLNLDFYKDWIAEQLTVLQL